MKIGFDLRSLVSDTENVTSDDTAVIKKLFAPLESSGNELFVFFPSGLDRKGSGKYKKGFLRKCGMDGVPSFRFACIGKDDITGAADRNHIDLFVTPSEQICESLSRFTDSVCSSGKSTKEILDSINAVIEKNREPVIPEDTEPSGLPSEERIWMKYYRKGDLRWNDKDLSPYERIVVSNQDWHDEYAMEYFGKKITYGEFFRRVEALSDVMYADGIRKGMCVPLIFANTPEAIIIVYALFRLKATIAPIFPMSTKEDMQDKISNICECNRAAGFSSTKVFMSDIVCDRFKDIFPADVQRIVVSISDSMPKLTAFAFRKFIAPKKGITIPEYSANMIPFKEYEARKAPHIEVDTSYDKSYPAVQLFTGGTIKPKGVLLSEENLEYASKQFYNDRYAFRRGDKIAAFLPLNHTFGLIIGTHVAATLGVELDVILRVDLERLDKLFLRAKDNLFGGVPNMFPAIRNNPRFRNADLSHVKYILSGGAMIDSTERERTTEFFRAHNSKAEVHDGYGMTESGGVIFDGIPNFSVGVKICGAGTENELGYEQLGELCLSGPQIMMGYEDSDLNKNVLRRHSDGKLWLHTGDNAMIRKNGRVEIIGRVDRMIKSSGEQIILDGIEELINTLPFVEKSAVVKRSDPLRGYVPVAYVKLTPDSEWTSKEEDAVMKIYEDKLAAYAHPRKTSVIDDFPVTAVGKVDFRALERMAEEENR